MVLINCSFNSHHQIILYTKYVCIISLNFINLKYPHISQDFKHWYQKKCVWILAKSRLIIAACRSEIRKQTKSELRKSGSKIIFLLPWQVESSKFARHETCFIFVQKISCISSSRQKKNKRKQNNGMEWREAWSMKV